MPKVTVIIPTYNDASRLHEGLRSLSYQSLKPEQIIVIDDGSTDSSALKEIEGLKQEFPDILFLRQENAGPSNARNHGLRLVETEFTVFLDADDSLREDAIDHRFKLMGGHSDVIASYSGYLAIEDGHEKRKSSFQIRSRANLNPDNVGHPNYYPGGTPLWLFRTEPLKTIGGFDLDLSIMEDFDLILRLQQLDGKISGDNAPVYIRNIRSDSHSRGSRRKRFRGNLQFLKKASKHGYFSHKELLRRYIALIISTLKP